MAAGDERLLVRRGHDLAGTQRREDGAEADDPAGGDDHQVDVVARRELLERVGPADPLRAGRQVQPGDGPGIAKGHGGGSQPRGLLGQQRPVGARRQRDDPEGVRVRGRTSTAWRPIEPVEPRRATPRGGRSPPAGAVTRPLARLSG